jgi:hypothetical protein
MFPWIKKCINEYKGVEDLQERFVKEMAQQELAKLKQHLKEIEWQYHTGSMGTTYYMCPACRGYKHSGHADDCWLHKAIKE